MSMKYFKDAQDKVHAFDVGDFENEAALNTWVADNRPGLTAITEQQADSLRLGPDADRLSAAKNARKEYMREQAASEIASSFTSSALGATHTYDSRAEDQNNLMLARDEAEKSSPQQAPVYANNGTEYDFRTHTLSQIQQVIADCSLHIRPIRQKLITKKSAIDAIEIGGDLTAAIAAVNAINW